MYTHKLKLSVTLNVPDYLMITDAIHNLLSAIPEDLVQDVRVIEGMVNDEDEDIETEEEKLKCNTK